MALTIRKSNKKAAEVFEPVTTAKLVADSIKLGILYETTIKKVGGAKLIPVSIFVEQDVEQVYIVPIADDMLLVKFVKKK